MNDVEYKAARATLEDAHRVIRETAEAVLAAAVVRGKAYVVRAHIHFEVIELPFLTLVEAQAFADSDECSPLPAMRTRVWCAIGILMSAGIPRGWCWTGRTKAGVPLLTCPWAR